MERYRVLVVTNLWPTEADPGYGAFVQAQMESLRPLGVEYDVLFINGRESKSNYLRAIGEVRRRVRQSRYDLIHAHFSLSGWVACFQFRVPIVVSFMGDDVLGRPTRRGHITLYGRFLRLSSFCLARLVSGVVVKSVEMKYILGLKSAQVIPNGVDLELFTPMDQEAARKALGLDLGKKYVLFPYNPAEARKRFDLVEEAVARARAYYPELEILIVRGEPQQRMPLYMNAADMLILASMYEGSPNAVKEAMATNLPVIAVPVGDTPEVIGSAEGSYLVSRDAGSITDKIVEVCRRGSRTQGRERVSKLTIENVAKQIVSVYAMLVADANKSRRPTGRTA
jgi:teichuronic acid biosynthesis glycosyltransferase TuaC